MSLNANNVNVCMERQTETDRNRDIARKSVCVCVCVRVCDRERQTDRQRQSERGTHRELHIECFDLSVICLLFPTGVYERSISDCGRTNLQLL